MKMPSMKFWRAAALMFFTGLPGALEACSVCAGNSDSKLAEGMNQGILLLLGVILFVLAWLVGFFVYLGRRAAAAAADNETEAGLDELSNPTRL
jgi:hypothetical protein